MIRWVTWLTAFRTFPYFFPLCGPQDDNGSPSPPTAVVRPENGVAPDEAPLPSGVFTLLTDCYSPTCSRDQLCYSIACPRRLEQQSRLNLKLQPGLSKQISKESLNDVPVRSVISVTNPQSVECFERMTVHYGFILSHKKLSIVFPNWRRSGKRL